jgi:cell fate (sporulation/competence/biofilm development) regulator YlbF (YheA/YmcA/DUF963 family)
MANSCALPPRYHTGISSDPQVLDASRTLANALENSFEFQEFARLAEAVNTDDDVYALLEEIRARHTSYSHSAGGELEARLEALPVMTAYRAAELGLRQLFAAVDEAIGQAAGVAFCEHVRPQGHG